MPELAEVEFYRKQWDAGMGKKILSVHLNAGKKVFRGTDLRLLRQALAGAKLVSSEAHGKQMVFLFSKGGWMGVHLGMTGKLRMEPAAFVPLKHDHLVLGQAGRSLVFSDPRQFGRVLFHQGKAAPAWWADRPAQILSPAFTLELMRNFLTRHARAPVKGTLLMQNAFPGLGNWMVDEILWQSNLHPGRPSGTLTAAEMKKLLAKIKHVSRVAMKIVGERDGDLPKSWLFSNRWGRTGRCPADGAALRRTTVAGRTTAWCPDCQKPGRGFN